MNIRTNNTTSSIDKNLLSQSLDINTKRCQIDLDKNMLRHSDLVMEPVTSVNPLSLAMPKFL